MSFGKSAWGVAAVLLGFAAFKLAILVHFGPFVADDTGGYRPVAAAILHDPDFWRRIPDWGTAALPSLAFRPIGYPLLLAALRNDPAVILCQVALSLTVAVLLCRLVREATGSPGLAVAAACFQLGGYSLLLDNSLLSDALYAGLFDIVVLTLLRASYRGRRLGLGTAAALGLAWGYSIWVRENGAYLTLVPLALIAADRRLGRPAIAAFLVPVVLLTGLYVGWNAYRTGDAFLGITGAANYLRPVFDIAKAGYADPFDDGSPLAVTVKRTMPDFDYPEQVVLLQLLHDEEGLSPLQLQHLAFAELARTVARHPLAYARVVLRNLDPSSYGEMLFNPVFTANEFFQLGVPPYRRVIPGTGLKSWKDLAAARDWGGLALAAASLAGLLASTALFLAVLLAVPALALRRPSPVRVLALKALGVFAAVALAFGLIHTEARHMLPVVPAALLAAAIAAAEMRHVTALAAAHPRPA